MRIFLLFIVLQVHSYTVESETICDLDFCNCKYNGGNLSVDCTFGRRALESNLSLPNKIVILDLSRSNLKYLQLSELFKSDTVEDLILNNNHLHKINGNLFQLPELRRLDLSDNYLEVIMPEVFIEITKLEYLNLANNKFKEISQVRFHTLVNLKEIILDNNNIGADIQNISLFDLNGCGLTLEIQSISLREIGLGNLDKNYFGSARSLTNLTVSKNNITKVFTLPDYLFFLDLSYNPIKLLNLNYYMGPLLRVLKVNNLEIEEVQNNVFLGPLIELELEGNKHLIKFSRSAFGDNIFRDDYDFLIKNLSMRRSNLSTLDKRLWILFKKVERLDLQDNPWICDCRIAWFLKLPIPYYLTEDLKCTSPPHFNNSKIFDLEQKDFICLQTTPDGPSAYQTGVPVELVLYSLLLIVTLILIIVFLYLTNNKDLCYVMFLVFEWDRTNNLLITNKV